MIRCLLFLSFLLSTVISVAQSAAINSDGSNADASAILDVKSTNKGMLVPRMTTAQRTAIASPAKGLLVFDNDTGDFWFYSGTAWTSLSSGPSTQYWAPNGNNISNTNTGSVGIGTTTPSSRAILHLNSTTQGLFLPSLNNTQMNAISGTTAEGLVVYNNEVKSPMIYTQRGYNYQIITGNYSRTNAWTPISPGPRMIAWGVVDSSGGSSDNVTQTVGIKSGSGNFSVSWNADERWYQLAMPNIEFVKDSMLLLITPVGNGTWDQAVSIGEFITSSSRSATIKFADISRIATGYSMEDSRRRSSFYFVLYSLRRDPF
ncbi:hypothetical protein [Lacibacter sp. H407]|uniref:hypothetical protein n=1 Tax=Lacibacter sp. H407 TaxID=3133423 RepID=UPI0030C5F8DB